MRVAALDMTNGSQECPSALIERQFAPNLRTCSRPEEEAGSLLFKHHNLLKSVWERHCLAISMEHLMLFLATITCALDGNYLFGLFILS